MSFTQRSLRFDIGFFGALWVLNVGLAIARADSDPNADRSRWESRIPDYLKERIRKDPSTLLARGFEFVVDEPNLPRVLLIGDSISMNYTGPVRERLLGKANVHRVPDNAGSTANALKHIDEWLGDGPWDVIHFNSGLHDLRRSNSGDRSVSPADYESNIQRLIDRVNRTGARLIFATTTPIPDGITDFKAGDETLYNDVARKVAQRNRVAIDDVYLAIKTRRREFMESNPDVHFRDNGSYFLAAEVAKSVLSALSAKPAGRSDTSGSANAGRDCYSTPLVWQQSIPQLWRDKFDDNPELAEAMSWIKESPTLPRVLLIGDSISIGYTKYVRGALSTKANLWRVPDNGRTTQYVLDHVDMWLGDRTWDVIHINVGLHDLRWKNSSFSVPPEQYGENLERIVRRLPRTAAVIFATTTPVPAGEDDRREGDERTYNDVAKVVMQRNGIRLNDLCAAVQTHLSEYQNARDVHFNAAGNEFLAERVVTEIERVLPSK